jgi:hypothetical protein
MPTFGKDLRVLDSLSTVEGSKLVLRVVAPAEQIRGHSTHKLLVVYNEPKVPAHFRKYCVEKHLPLASKIAGVKAGHFSVVGQFDLAASQDVAGGAPDQMASDT